MECSIWGEHEIDYVLFYTIPSKKNLTIKPNPDEIDAIKWVSQTQLLSMMDDPKLLFSPWFRIIVNKWVLGNKNTGKRGWWDDLPTTMNTDTFVDVVNVLRFDPPNEHMGGGGDAGPMFGGDGENSGSDHKSSDESHELVGDST